MEEVADASTAIEQPVAEGDANMTAAADHEDEHDEIDQAEDAGQMLQLPLGTVKRLVKSVLAPEDEGSGTAQRMSAKSTEIISRSSAAFVLYVMDAVKETAEASKGAGGSITRQDVLRAIRLSGFEEIAAECEMLG